MAKLRAVFKVVLVAIATGTSSADEKCNDQLLVNPYVKGVNECIVHLRETLDDPNKRRFAEKLIEKALSPNRKSGNDGPGTPLSYYLLSDLVVKIATPDITDVFLYFISPGSEDETRSIAAANIYELNTPLVLERMALLPAKSQESVVFTIAWGLANKYYKKMNNDNYRILAVGSHQEVLQKSYPNRNLVVRIENELKLILDESNKQ